MTGKRETWKNGLEFLFSCVGVSVGLGNIWRFPYICYKNGGGAFLIPYFLFLGIIGIPQILLQFSYPQFSSLGPAKAWICCPLFRGIGFMMIVTNAIIGLYYNVIIAWTLYYFANCFKPTVPWNSCDNAWNTDHCFSRTQPKNITMWNASTIAFNISLSNDTNETLNQILPSKSHGKSGTEEFWQYNVLELSSGVDDLGLMRWSLLFCNLGVSVVVYLCVFNGIKLSGKVMYIAATIPYVFLSILLIKGLTLTGALRGLHYYFVPRWGELLKLSVWFDAAVQVVFSLGFGTGDHIFLASHNKFHHNLYRDAMIVPIVDAFTSLFSGCVIFVTLGYMSSTFNLDIKHVVADGPGIAFMIFPEALATLPIPQLWSALFFLTLFTVGLDSRIVMIQVLTGALSDLYPDIFRAKLKWTSAAVSLFTFVFGIPFVYQGGMYVLQLADWYLTSVAVLLIVIMESTVLAWIYGSERLSKDISSMIGFRIPKVWQILWKYITPCCLLLMQYGSSLVCPGTELDKASSSFLRGYFLSYLVRWSWIIAIIPILPIPIGMLVTLLSHDGSILQRVKKSTVPLREWTNNERREFQLKEYPDDLWL